MADEEQSTNGIEAGCAAIGATNARTSNVFQSGLPVAGCLRAMAAGQTETLKRRLATERGCNESREVNLVKKLLVPDV